MTNDVLAHFIIFANRRIEEVYKNIETDVQFRAADELIKNLETEIAAALSEDCRSLLISLAHAEKSREYQLLYAVYIQGLMDAQRLPIFIKPMDHSI